MKTRMWSATLDPTSPRYADWRKILGDFDNVPLVDANRRQAEPIGEHYLVDVDALTPDQKARLIAWVAEKFEATPAAVEAEIIQRGFPIRAGDVIVSFSMRGFM